MLVNKRGPSIIGVILLASLIAMLFICNVQGQFSNFFFVVPLAFSLPAKPVLSALSTADFRLVALTAAASTIYNPLLKACTPPRIIIVLANYRQQPSRTTTKLTSRTYKILTLQINNLTATKN